MKMVIFTKKHPTTIFEALEIDLKNYPDNSFTQIEKNEKANTYQKIDKENKFISVFPELSVICFQDNNHKNYLFKCPPYEFNRNIIPELIEKIYPIYGKDESGDGLFTKNDLKEIESGFWMGRRWTKEKYPFPCAINYNEEDGLSFNIWT